MKYFIDTEFIEGFHKPFLGKRRHFIDLISIGIVDEDGREYSAISNEYNYKDAEDWVKENVITPLYSSTVHGFAKNHIYASNFHKHYGKSNAQIAQEVFEFIYPHLSVGGDMSLTEKYKDRGVPTFYGYYSDYDWVLFCSLYGRMIDLPKSFPMYCRDLKQMQDETAEYLKAQRHDNLLVERMRDATQPTMIERQTIQDFYDYPKQSNEHNALSDARWNKQLYDFINSIT